LALIINEFASKRILNPMECKYLGDWYFDARYPGENYTEIKIVVNAFHYKYFIDFRFLQILSLIIFFHLKDELICFIRGLHNG